MRRMRWLPALGLGLVLTGVGLDRCPAQMDPVTNGRAQPPGNAALYPAASQTGLVPAPAAPAGDPYEGIRVTPQAGAWLICLASFSGKESPDFARQMIACVRNKYHMPAYVFDYENQKQRAENEAEREYARTHPGHRPRITRIEEHCAILVGGYPTVDAANAALKEIHKWPPPDIHLPSGAIPFPSKYDVVKGKDGQDSANIVIFNPCATAFAIRNPVSPETQPALKPKFDPAWPRMNSDEEFSIYGCRKPWTLAITQYNCFSSTQRAQDSPSMLEKLWNSAHARNDQIDVAALNAHDLAKFLRRCNLEAYVLHTKTSSIVTVGGFMSPNDPNMDGACRQLLDIRRQLDSRAGKTDLVQFFPNPMPMEVPH
jgi:hypothetical protein